MPPSQGPRRNRPERRTDWARRDREDKDDTLGAPGKSLGRTPHETVGAGTLPLATVTVLFRGTCAVRMDDGSEQRCVVRRTLAPPEAGTDPPVVVGDRVRVSGVGDTLGAVERVEPRRSRLDRIHPADAKRKRPRTQVLVANVDQVAFIAALADPELRPGLVDRFLVATAATDLPIWLVFNKADLVPVETEYEQVYRGLGYRVLRTSAETGEGLEAFRSLLAGKSTVVSGHSGVGKSSLLHAADPGIDMMVADVNPVTGRGRHTTTSARMYRSPSGTIVIDTPGIREFEPCHADLGTLGAGYREFVEPSRTCRFSGCSHRHEPACAVRDAVETGTIARFRYESYLRLVDSLEESARHRHP